MPNQSRNSRGRIAAVCVIAIGLALAVAVAARSVHAQGLTGLMEDTYPTYTLAELEELGHAVDRAQLAQVLDQAKRGKTTNEAATLDAEFASASAYLTILHGTGTGPTIALYATRMCAQADVAGGALAVVDDTETGPLVPEFGLRLFDRRGQLVGTFNGTDDVCDFARFAATYAEHARVEEGAHHE